MSLAVVLELIKDLLKAIPIFDRWFTKTTQEKVEDSASKIRAEFTKQKDDGRPPA